MKIESNRGKDKEIVVDSRADVVATNKEEGRVQRDAVEEEASEGGAEANQRTKTTTNELTSYHKCVLIEFEVLFVLYLVFVNINDY